MKKLLLIFTLAVAAFSCASAMSLKDAFGALSNLQYIGIKETDFGYSLMSDAIHNVRAAAVANLDREKIKEVGDATYAILNQVPLVYMVNGANNNEVAAFVYATPNEIGSNDILIIGMSGYSGSVLYMLGTISDDDLLLIQNAPLEMHGNNLSLTVPMPDKNKFSLTISE